MTRTPRATDADAAGSWTKLFETMQRLQGEMEALASGRPLDLAEGQRYLARLLAAALARAGSRKRVEIDYATPRIGGFNPDYRFGSAALEPHTSYRIRGRMNDVHRLGIGTYPGGLGRFEPIGYLARDAIDCDADGGFEILVADARPQAQQAGAAHDWLPRSPDANVLMVRQLLLQPDARPADLRLERIGGVESLAAPTVLDAGRQRREMDGAVLFVAGAAAQFFRWTRTFSRLHNRIAEVPAELEAEVKADPDTFYAIGYFDLAPGEWLDIRFTPPACDYWGLGVTNHWLEPIEHDDLPTHHNHATAKPEPDGEVRLRLAPDEDGLGAAPNPLHTLGHRNGALFFRVIGAHGDEPRLPQCRARRG